MNEQVQCGTGFIHKACQTKLRNIADQMRSAVSFMRGDPPHRPVPTPRYNVQFVNILTG